MSNAPISEIKRLSGNSSVPCIFKRKLAPRSSLQFKIGPQFTPTVVQNTIIDSKGEQLTPILTPRIDRGFERIEDEWVGYKRNYFTLVSAFHFEGVSFLKFAADLHYTIDPDTNLKLKIKYFGIRLISKCADDDTNVSLVQHTAKRDRGPQFEPPVHPAVPSDLPDHNIIRGAANVRNASKISKLNRIFFFDRDDKSNVSQNFEGLMDYPTDKIIKVARYERIQFSSSINYKKPTLNNKRLKLLVELVGFTDLAKCLPLAYTETPPLIVRGRSPSNYQGPVPDPHESVTDASIVQSTPLGNLDDFDTYQILKMATEDLELNPSALMQPKKKRGRKPKPKAAGEGSGSIKKSKKSTDCLSESGKSKKLSVARKKKSTMRNSEEMNIKNLVDIELLKIENNKGSHIKDSSLSCTPSKITNKLADENEYSCEFDTSAQLVDLFDNQMHYNSIQEKSSYTSLIAPINRTSNPLTSCSLETYENDFLLLKTRLQEEKHLHGFHEDFAQVNPSAMLEIDDYEDGPSYISYN